MNTEQRADAATESIRGTVQPRTPRGVAAVELAVAASRAERAARTAAYELERAKTYIENQNRVLAHALNLLRVVQSSKFWRLRNAWFALKAKAGIDRAGPTPHWMVDVAPFGPAPEADIAYDRWLQAHAPRAADVQRMRDVLPLFAARPRFSVVMPVYDTPEPLLRQAIESVIGQVYPDWELCIADDASPSPHVRAVLDEYAASDPRIRVVYRTTNGHIAAASNSALAIATGEFVALLDHDDMLAVDALYQNALVVNRRPDVDVLYSDEDKIDEDGRRRDPYFKPDWSPDSLLARNYVSHLGVYRRSLLEAIGGFRVGFEGSQDYDLVLRATEHTERIEHIPHVLYHWRVHAGSTAATRDDKHYAYDAAVRAIAEALVRRGEPGRVETRDVAGLYTVRYGIETRHLVSVIMPTRDHGADVDRALRSLFQRSTYRNFEVVLLDNGSTEAASLETFARWERKEPDRVRVVRYDAPFNFPAINNHAAAHARGPYLLFLNNDTELLTPDGIQAMVEQVQRPSIGAVGAKLLYEDGTIQHAGVIVGLGGVAGHSHKHYPAENPGYFYTLQTVNNFSAVTAACLMVRKSTFEEVGRFDETLAIAFNDVDFCLRLREAGYRNVYLPHVVLYHYESKSRGHENTPEKIRRFQGEMAIMHERWRTAEVRDPYYNPNLTLDAENYAIGV